MTLKRVLLAATILATPVAASAQPVTGLYVGAGAGVNWISNPEKWDISGSAAPGNFGLTNNTTITNAGKANFHTGWAGVGSLGWGFGNGFRAEIEGNYRANEVDSIRGNLAPVGRTGGFQYTYGVMANVLYDFDFANFGMGQSIFQPYVGVGVGYAWTQWRNIRGQSNRAGAGGAVIYADDTDAQFAYQGILGVGTPLTWLGVTGLTLTAEYRFFGTLQPNLDSTLRNPITNVVVAGGKLSPDNYNHSVMLGLRYALFQPPPPPPPVAVAPRRGAGPGAHLPGLLRLGSRRPDRPRAGDHRRGGVQRRPGAGDADRGGRPCRPLRLARLQPAPVAAPRRCGRGRAGRPRHQAQRDQRQRLWREPPAGADRRRRARAAEPPRRDRPALAGDAIVA